MIKRAYIDIPEGQVHYQAAGSGEPILLLHQTPQSADEYVHLIPILAKDYHVIAMDTLGYGNSDPPPRQYEIADYARSVVSFLQALGITKTHILGHHTGASIAVELAAAYPDLVDKLILFGCPNFNPELVQQYLDDPGFQPMQIKKDGSHASAIWQHLLSVLPDADPKVLHFLFTNHMIVAERFEQGFIAAFRYVSTERLPLIKSPTLLICGDEDLVYEQFESVRELIPRCQPKIIKGSEIFPIEMAEALAKEVLDFLKSPGV
jgi:pimeloyl-ACP methyl ester carboxylesterase